MNHENNNGMSAHFKREANLMLWFVVIVLTIGIAVAIIAPKINIFVQQDKCLDSGGSYDKKTHECHQQ